MPFQSIIMDEHLPSFTTSGPSAALDTISPSSQGNMPTLLEDMPVIFDHLTLAPGATSGAGIPISRPPIGETLVRATPENLPSPQKYDAPIAPPHIPSAGPNGVVITSPHPRSHNYPPRIYRERTIGSASSGHRGLYLASPLAEPSGSYVIPQTNHVRTMELPENNPFPGWNGRRPYFYTNTSPNPVYRPLAETNNIGRYTNRPRRTGPHLRFQFARREPQRPARPVRRPEPVLEILEEDGPRNEVRRDLERSEDEGMDMFYLNSAALF